IWDAINDGTIYSCPSLLASFTVICYADLKKYRFTYHFGFPALHSESPWKLATKTNLSSDEHTQTEGQMTPHEQFTGEETIALVDSVQTWRYAVDARQYGFFLAKRVHGKRLEDGSTNSGENVSDDLRPMTPGTPGLELGFAWVVGSLASFEGGFFNGVDQKDRFVCFADPSTYPGYPGWMLRNLLILVRQRWKLKEVQILCYRDVQARRHEARSIILNIQLDPQAGSDPEPSLVAPGPASTTIEMPRVTGWERNAAGKLKSKMANLAESMDPQR
ncbi:Autophagy protein 7, partial [Loxospora ochrophaea]|nr:Autophagy protein 7 [Loxospora ochrophaea]